MSRLAKSLVSASMVLLIAAAPAGAQDTSSSFSTNGVYFPIKEGMKWTYEAFVDQKPAGTLVSVMGPVTSRSGVTSTRITTTTKISGGDGPGYEYRSSVQYDVFAGEVRGTFSDSEIHVIQRLPLSTGSRWEYQGGWATVDTDSVSTPYKRFDLAKKVTCKTRSGTTESRWYADGFGLVRCTILWPDGRTSTVALTGFEQPRD